MRTLMAMLALILLSTPVVAAQEPEGDSEGGPTWYLALGDSLAAGYQPIGDPADDHRTRSSYPDQLWLMARQEHPALQLRNLACPGADTESIWLDYPRCSYPHGSQMDEALAFIDEHRDELAFITIDIGFNDFDCESMECLLPGIAAIGQRLPPILEALQAAAPGVPIVGMNIYDPFLVLWFDEESRGLAGQSVLAIELINTALEDVYAKAGVPVADVAGAFDNADWETRVSMAGRGEVPRNVALVCERTWLCHEPPLGPDRHPNALGFRVMADAFAVALGLDPVGVDLEAAD